MSVFELEGELKSQGYELIFQSQGVYRNIYNIQGYDDMPEMAVYGTGDMVLRVWQKGNKTKVIPVTFTK